MSARLERLRTTDATVVSFAHPPKGHRKAGFAVGCGSLASQRDQSKLCMAAAAAAVAMEHVLPTTNKVGVLVDDGGSKEGWG